MSIVLEDSNLNVAEQVNVLFKSSLGFPSTNETKPWYTETNVKYNNYTFGDEILLDEIPENPTYESNIQNFNTVKVDPNQIATGGYIKEDTTGVIRYYNRLILNPVPGSSNNSYYALDTNQNNILTNGLQFNTKWEGGQSAKIYPYQLYNEQNINANNSAPNELQSGPTGGNWTYDFKNGIIFFADYNTSLCNGTDNRPVFSFYKYIGRKGVAKQIAIKDSINDVTSPENNQIVVQKSDDTIHRYNGSSQTWIPIGGSGGGSSGSTQTYTNQILEQSGNEIQVPNDKHKLPFNQFTDVSGSETSFTFNDATTQLIYKFSFNLTWNSPTDRGDTISEYQLVLSHDGVIFKSKKTFRLRNSLFSENFATIEHIIEKGSYSTITVKLQGKSINPDYLQKVNYTYFNPSYHSGSVVNPILEITKIGSRTIEAEALFNKDSNDNIYYTNGKVGIGTNNPTNNCILNVNIPNNSQQNIAITNSADSGMMYLKRDSNGKSFILNNTFNPLILGANNSQSQLYLKEDGNVGIGTNNPTNKLEVSGNTLLLNDLTVKGTTVLKDISGADASFNNVDICGNKLSAKDIHISGNIYQNGTLFSTSSDSDDLTLNNLKLNGNLINKFNENVYQQRWNLYQKLEASDGVVGDKFGASVSVSGLYAVVGYPQGTGAVYIFENADGIWTQKQKIVAPSSSSNGLEQKFGWSVAISGNYFIVGAPGMDGKGNDCGRAYIYKLENNIWIRDGNPLMPNGLTNNDFFGISVAIDEDYAIASCGGSITRDSTFKGKVYIFERNNGNWGNNGDPAYAIWHRTETIRLESSNIGNTDHFGSSVSISGKNAIIGAYKNGVSGSAYIFERDNAGNWGKAVVGQSYRTENTILKHSEGNSEISFGWSVSIHNDYAIIGAPQYAIDNGAAYIFERNNEGNWGKTVDGQIYRIQNKKLAIEKPEYIYFGYSVAINGNNAIIGNNCNILRSGTGNVYLYERDTKGDWIQKEKKVASTESTDNHFGVSVAINDNFAIAGSYIIQSVSTNSGFIQIYKNFGKLVCEDIGTSGEMLLKTNDITRIKITSEDVEIFNNLKLSKNITNSRDEDILDQNEINVLSNEKYYDLGSSGKIDDKLGGAVVINGNFAVIGKPTTNSSNIGEVYIYKKDNTGIWNQYQILRASILVDTNNASKLAGVTDYMGFGNFGGSIGFDGNYIIVGGKAFELETGEYGAAFIFEKGNDGYWGTLVSGTTYYNENQILFGTNDAGSGNIKDFGQSVSIDGTTAIVGSNDTYGTGSVFVFERDLYLGKWGRTKAGKSYRTQNVQLTTIEYGSNPQYNGESVAIYGDTIISGGRRSFSNSGVIYFYNKDSIGEWGVAIQNTSKYRNFTQMIRNPKGTAQPYQFGFAVDIYDNYAIASAPEGSRGYVYIYEKSDTGNWSQIAEVNDVDGNTWERFGHSVSINNNFAIIGKPQHDSTFSGQKGCAYMITKNNEQWGLPSTGSHRLVNSKIVPDGTPRPYANFGASVSSFNNEVIIGAPTFNQLSTDNGRFYFYSITYSYTFRTLSTNLISNSKDKLQLPQYVGIGTASSDPSDTVLYGLIINGKIKASSSTIQTSDDRVKHNEINITNALQTINALQPKKYIKTQELYSKNHNFILDSSNNPIDESGNLIDYFIEAGIIAQEIKEVDELAIFVKGEEVDKNGTPTALGVDYNSIFCYSLQAIKELDEKNSELKTELSTLKSQMSDVLTRLSQLESN